MSGRGRHCNSLVPQLFKKNARLRIAEDRTDAGSHQARRAGKRGNRNELVPEHLLDIVNR